MIVSLSGVVSEKSLDMIVVDVMGVGYGVLVPVSTHTQLAIQDEVKLYIHEHIRESSYDLFGFLEVETKALFEQLLSVNGVGPKVALSILNTGSVSEVRQAIASGNLKFIQSASGVGKRVAERIIVDLKDKVGLLSSIDEQVLLTGDSEAQKDEAVEALVSLGYSIFDAVNALSSIDKNLKTEERITLALRIK